MIRAVGNNDSYIGENSFAVRRAGFLVAVFGLWAFGDLVIPHIFKFGELRFMTSHVVFWEITK